MKRLLALAAFLFLMPGMAGAQDGLCISDADGNLTTTDTGEVDGYTADNEKAPCPDQFTFVPLSVLEAAAPDFDGSWTAGVWNGTNFRPHVTQLPYERQTATVQMQRDCRLTERRIVAMLRTIRDDWSRVFPAGVIKPAIAMLVQIRKGIRGVVLQTNNAEWTQARRHAFLRKSGDADGDKAKAEDVLTRFVNSWETGLTLTVGARRMVWVDPVTGAALTTVETLISSRANHESDMFAEATDPTIWTRVGGWCAAITG